MMLANCARSSRRSSYESTSPIAAERGRVPRRHARRHAQLVRRFFGDERPEPTTEVTLSDFDPDGEDKVLAAICYSHSSLPEAQLWTGCAALRSTIASAMQAYVGERGNRRHKPGRAFERTGYRFDWSDYGAFRDLQRHRMLTIEWQHLTPHHGFGYPGPLPMPDRRRYDEAWNIRRTLPRSSNSSRNRQLRRFTWLSHALRHADERARGDAPERVAKFPQGHATDRRVAQEMHRRSPRGRATGRSPKRCASSTTKRPIWSGWTQSTWPRCDALTNLNGFRIFLAMVDLQRHASVLVTATGARLTSSPDSG